jgi:undecaprenyl-diphosphatase
MLELLNQWDTNIFLALNGLNHPLLDPVMIFISDSKIPIITLLVLFIVFGYLKLKKHIFIAIICAMVGIGISDSVSSRVFKPGFKRLRPCKVEVLKDKVHLAGKKCWGGKYGFFSSHASNTFTMALFFWLLFRRFNRGFVLLFPYAILVSYSRIYLAKHYPGDLFAGAIFGLLCGFLMYKLYQFINDRFQKPSFPDL